MMLARVALFEALQTTTSQVIVGIAIVASLAFVIYLLTRRGKA